MNKRPPLSASTAVAGVIGDPVRHSLSPALHNAAFAALGLDWIYGAFPVAGGSGADAVAAMSTLGIRGLSVTMPHKAAVARAADQRTPAVAALGVANCLVLEPDGLVTAHNTDGAGFLAGLVAETGESLRGRSIVVLGAGGAARAVVHACGAAGAASITVVNRTERHAVDAAALAGGVGSVGTTDSVASADLVINATPVGMDDDGLLPCDADAVRAGQTVVDLIYSPWETAWLAHARRRGATALNGFGMLLHQAAIQFEIWTGESAPLAEMAAVAQQEINRA